MPRTTYSLAGRTVIVTGAADGIGRALAARFHDVKAFVVAVDVDGVALLDLDSPVDGGLSM